MTAPTWTFGDRLLRIRRSLNLDQSAMATLIGVTRKSLSRWENDDRCGDPHDVATRYERAAREMGHPEFTYDWIVGRADAGYLQLPNSQEISLTAA